MIKNRSIYARKFDKNVISWDEDVAFNRLYLQATQSYFNELLMARGYVFLRDVYEKLGFRITKESIAVGWYYDREDSKSHNYISFSLDDSEDDSNLWVDFNVDGDISNHF